MHIACNRIAENQCIYLQKAEVFIAFKLQFRTLGWELSVFWFCDGKKKKKEGSLWKGNSDHRYLNPHPSMADTAHTTSSAHHSLPE